MAKKRPKRRPGRFLLFLVVAAALVGIGFFLGQRAVQRATRAAPSRSARPAPLSSKPAAREGAEQRGTAPAEPERAPSVPGRVAIVIDDLGRSTEEVDRLLALGVPLGFAVLPFETKSAEVAAKIVSAKGELLCHLPMEATGRENPGPNAILERQEPERIEQLTRRSLDALPAAVGVNNHMGSRITADRAAMSAVLDVVAERGLFFLDSRTTPETVAFELARRRSIPAARRDVFLDEDPSAAAVEAEFDRLLELARVRGAAIAIGHPHAVTLEMLERRVPEARAAGYEFVPVSFLLERSEDLP